jgi:hypothetical protein
MSASHVQNIQLEPLSLQLVVTAVPAMAALTTAVAYTRPETGLPAVGSPQWCGACSCSAGAACSAKSAFAL